jgi:hypothetical protein
MRRGSKKPPPDKLFLHPLEHLEDIWEHVNGHGNAFTSWHGCLTGARGATVHPQFDIRCPMDVPEYRTDVLKLTTFYPAKFLLHR